MIRSVPVPTCQFFNAKQANTFLDKGTPLWHPYSRKLPKQVRRNFVTRNQRPYAIIWRQPGVSNSSGHDSVAGCDRHQNGQTDKITIASTRSAQALSRATNCEFRIGQKKICIRENAFKTKKNNAVTSGLENNHNGRKPYTRYLETVWSRRRHAAVDLVSRGRLAADEVIVHPYTTPSATRRLDGPRRLRRRHERRHLDHELYLPDRVTDGPRTDGRTSESFTKPALDVAHSANEGEWAASSRPTKRRCTDRRTITPPPLETLVCLLATTSRS